MGTRGVIEILVSIGLVSSIHIRDIFGASINSLQTCDSDQDMISTLHSSVYF